MTTAPQPLIGFGQVRHRRFRPREHAFAYPGFFLVLPMRTLRQRPQDSAWPINRRGWLSFYDTDHGDGRGPERGGALGWLDEQLQAHGIHDATGETWLLCYPRVLGYVFKPVSFWFCHRPAEQGGALRAIVAEVNNTFGERHWYVLEADRWGTELRADKSFHVSPFCDVKGEYRFRFLRAQRGTVEHMVACVDYWDDVQAHAPLLKTSISGELQPLQARSARQALWRHPFMTAAIIARIHWHALRLWLKRVPVFRHTARPDAVSTSPSLTSGPP